MLIAMEAMEMQRMVMMVSPRQDSSHKRSHGQAKLHLKGVYGEGCISVEVAPQRYCHSANLLSKTTHMQLQARCRLNMFS